MTPQALAEHIAEIARTGVVKYDDFERLEQAAKLLAGMGEPVAWERRWHADGIRDPRKRDGVKGWQLLPVTVPKLFDDDRPLFAPQEGV